MLVRRHRFHARAGRRARRLAVEGNYYTGAPKSSARLGFLRAREGVSARGRATALAVALAPPRSPPRYALAPPRPRSPASPSRRSRARRASGIRPILLSPRRSTRRSTRRAPRLFSRTRIYRLAGTIQSLSPPRPTRVRTRTFRRLMSLGLGDPTRARVRSRRRHTRTSAPSERRSRASPFRLARVSFSPPLAHASLTNPRRGSPFPPGL